MTGALIRQDFKIIGKTKSGYEELSLDTFICVGINRIALSESSAFNALLKS